MACGSIPGWTNGAIRSRQQTPLPGTCATFATDSAHSTWQPLPTMQGPGRSLAAWASSSGTLRRIPDRKSTRLNSSHVEISYAVFCLKKKILATWDGISTEQPSVILCGTLIGRGVPMLAQREKAQFMRIDAVAWQICRDLMTAGYRGV